MNKCLLAFAAFEEQNPPGPLAWAGFLLANIPSQFYLFFA
jgi:hypothetical protein